MDLPIIPGNHLLVHFPLDPSYLNINFGSFGCPTNRILSKQHEYQAQMDFNPEKWFRYELFPHLNEIRSLIASYINCSLKNLALIQNASDGANAVLRSNLTKNKEKVLVFDLAYPMLMNTLIYLKSTFQIEIFTMTLDPEALNSDEKILDKFIETIEKEGPFKIACFDHISSTPSLIFPVKRLTEICRKHNIISVIDGAHAIGHIPLDLTDLNPDYYFSNFHKWGFAPKPAAFLFVGEGLKEITHPTIISNKYKEGFIEEFDNTGTRDHSAILAIKDALEFRFQFGDLEIKGYNHNLAWSAGLEISRIWGSEMLIRDKERVGAMVNVRIPCEDKDIIEKIVYKALYEYNVYFVTVKVNDGKYYARFSAQVFNDIGDYVKAAEVFLKLLKEFKKKD